MEKDYYLYLFAIEEKDGKEKCFFDDLLFLDDDSDRKDHIACGSFRKFPFHRRGEVIIRYMHKLGNRFITLRHVCIRLPEFLTESLEKSYAWRDDFNHYGLKITKSLFQEILRLGGTDRMKVSTCLITGKAGF